MAGTAEEHARVMTWAYGLVIQTDRLHADRLAFMRSSQRVREAGYYGDEDAKPPRLMNADAHLLLVAAAQLAKSLDAFDGDLRLPPELTKKQIRLLRNALEHWEGGWAVEEMSKLQADSSSNHWRADGSGMLGDIVDDRALRAWGQTVYDDLVTYDPLAPGHVVQHRPSP